MVPWHLEVLINLSFQINGFKRDYNDYDTPTFLVKEHEDHHDTKEKDTPGKKRNFKAHNKVENSYSDSSSFGFGGSYMLDSGFAGISFSQL